MPNFCAVYKCSSRSNRELSLSFFRIPAIINHQGEKTKELSSLRRKKWLDALKRPDLTEEKCARCRPVVCSKHFHSGKPSQLYDEENPDWSPSLLLGYGKVEEANMSVIERYKRRKARQRKQHAACVQHILPDQSLLTNIISPLNDETLPVIIKTETVDSGHVTDAVTETDLKMADLDALHRELLNSTEIIVNLKQKLSLKDQFSKESFQENNQKVKYYSGLPNYQTMIMLFQMVEPFLPGNVSLSKFHQFVMTCMKLRLNLQQVDLSYRFDISSATVSRILNTCIGVLYSRLSDLVPSPAREELHRTPLVRKKYSILQGTLPIDTFNGKDSDPIDKIAFICHAMTNLSSSLVLPD